MSDLIKTYCSRLCGGACGILVKVVDGKVIGVQGNPDCAFNEGYICPKGRALPELTAQLPPKRAWVTLE